MKFFHIMSTSSRAAQPVSGGDGLRDYYEKLTGQSRYQCPQCRQGRMLVVAILPRSLYKAVPPIDSS
jgi:hypothetical protein